VEEQAFNGLSDLAQRQEAIARVCALMKARLYRANDDGVYMELARREVDWYAINNTLSHVVAVPHPGDGLPHYRLYPKNQQAHYRTLGQSLASIWPGAGQGVCDPRTPTRLRWWQCFKDLGAKWA
jgi:hypothetical protein